MKEFKQLLFPVDLSENVEKRIPFVRELTEKLDARLHLLFVVDDIERYAGLYVPHPSLRGLQNGIEKGASEKLEAFCAEHFPQGGVQCQVAVGEPALKIIEYASENDIDMILMCTHGRKGIDRLCFGSVAEKVVKRSPVPVLSINPDGL